MKVLAMVLAGGQGARLHPLSAVRSKPAVPFGSRYRIVDFVLSNLANSGVHAIYLLVQYKSQSLIEHVSKAWAFSRTFPGEFVSVVPPQMMEGKQWFQGTADAVFQNVSLIERHAPEGVAILGADHIYRMDFSQMLDFHRASRAHVTVAAIPVPLAQASQFGVIQAAPDGRIADFLEKPVQPPAMANNRACAYGSMGNYLFETDVLIAALHEARRCGETDFGRHILPRLVRSHRVHAYNFAENHIPGIRAYEEAAYWRDVGSVDSYYAAHQDVLGAAPRFNLSNPHWFIRSSNYQGPSPRILAGQIENSAIGAGTLVKGGRIRNSIIRREVIIEPDVEIDDCIIMDYTIIRRGSRLRRVIVDRYNVIAQDSRIGFAPLVDGERYSLSPGGIVVVPRGPDIPDLTRYEG
ncbi:MAG: glucose-1-phosphate adenylyltransferase [Betaproteobacteria bacterium HGW-Betaproteobacteria-10]|nr:MAG: glucose-1-phosphate adenylyltransferase [Betaproteobacteria bacterium HGW-Betaproteobacteria-10]